MLSGARWIHWPSRWPSQPEYSNSRPKEPSLDTYGISLRFDFMWRAVLIVAGIALVGAWCGAVQSRQLRRVGPPLLTYVREGAQPPYRPYGLCLTQADGSHRLRLNRLEARHPSWSPTGNLLAFRGSNVSDIVIANARGQVIRRLTRPVGDEYKWSPSWSPDGRWIAFLYTNGGAPEVLAIENPRGGELRTLFSVPADSHTGLESVAWAPDSKHLAFSEAEKGKIKIYTVGRDGQGLRFLLSGTDPAYSPDGSKIAFITQSPAGSNNDLYLANTDGSGVRQLTDTPTEQEAGPAWSPNGRLITFSRVHLGPVGVGHSEIVGMTSDGKATHTLISNPSYHALDATWRPAATLPTMNRARC
jgi:Tol biopolymer transport system component